MSTLHASAAPFLAGMNLAPGGPGPAGRETLQGLGYPRGRAEGLVLFYLTDDDSMAFVLMCPAPGS